MLVRRFSLFFYFSLIILWLLRIILFPFTVGFIVLYAIYAVVVIIGRHINVYLRERPVS